MKEAYPGVGSRAFTLIELLVVVAIIGVLASVVLATLGSAREKAKTARAKAEVTEIIKAAELVFSDFGYYPNDSHGSVICPQDIIVDQSSGATWGDYIKICNDPWGHPYEWNNQCGGGGTRQPHAPFDPVCLSFSDANPGPVGVTIVGPDSVNNNCTGDDMCSGTRGHAVYGWDGQVTQSGPMCVNTVSNCSGLTQIGCITRTGCSLGGNSCGGTVSCSTYNSDQTTCQNSGCSFTTSGCSGIYVCSQWDNTSQAICEGSGHECVWGTAFATSCRTISGASRQCSNLPSCAGVAGCTVGTTSCTGSPSCSTFGSSQCSATSGCTWNSGTCTGTAVSCTTLGDQSSCVVQSGCSWQ